ncbi:MAG: hypothetical protein ACREDI_15330 [Roseiarcus sp.]
MRALFNPRTNAAFSAELKSTFCLVKDGEAIVSQHIGDLEDAPRHCHGDSGLRPRFLFASQRDGKNQLQRVRVTL